MMSHWAGTMMRNPEVSRPCGLALESSRTMITEDLNPRPPWTRSTMYNRNHFRQRYGHVNRYAHTFRPRCLAPLAWRGERRHMSSASSISLTFGAAQDPDAS